MIFSNVLENRGFYNFFMYCINFCAFAVVPNFGYCVIYFAVKLNLLFHLTLLCNS